jgi:hypothetical protein
MNKTAPNNNKPTTVTKPTTTKPPTATTTTKPTNNKTNLQQYKNKQITLSRTQVADHQASEVQGT